MPTPPNPPNAGLYADLHTGLHIGLHADFHCADLQPPRRFKETDWNVTIGTESGARKTKRSQMPVSNADLEIHHP